MATNKEQDECRNCPRPEDINNPDAPEYFSWMKAINFNVTKAKKLVAGLPEKRFGHMTRKQIEQFGFTLATEPDDSGYISLGFYYHNDAHLAHIPADAMEAPVILATVEYTNKDKRDNLRALRAARRKLETALRC